MEDTYKFEGYIEDVHYKDVYSDEWHHGNLALESHVIKDHPEIVVAFGFEDGEDTAHVATEVFQKVSENESYGFKLNEMYIDEEGVHVPRYSIEDVMLQ